MAECLFRPGQECTCSLNFTLKMLEGVEIDRNAARRIMGRACPNKPPEKSKEKGKE